MICDYQTNKVYLAEGIKGYPKVAENLLYALYKEGIETEYLPHSKSKKHVWARDYMPIQLEENLFLKYYPEYYGWFDYPADKTAAFCKSDEPWGILGNFGKTSLIVGGVPFDCAEKLFQVMKFSATESRRLVYSVSGQHIKMTAKRKDLAPTIRSDWGMIIVDVLKFCLMQKYEQSEAFREELERSRELYIVEVQNNSRKPADTYSAKLSPDGKTWSGPNLMGRLLMELRDNGKLEWHLPDDAMDFSDLKA